MVVRKVNEAYDLKLVGFIVQKVIVESTVLLGLEGSTPRETATVLIEGAFTLKQGNETFELNPVSLSRDTTPNFLGKRIVKAVASTGGALTIALDDASRLEVPASLDYEAWEVSKTDSLVVSQPGGELATWHRSE